MHSSLEAEIDHFHFNKEGEVSTRPVELSDSSSDLDRFSVAHSLKLIVARIDTSQETEEEDMDLKPRSGLRGLMSNRNKGQSSKNAPKEQVPASLPPPPPSPTDLALQPIQNLRRKRPVNELKERDIGPQNAKQHKKGKEPKNKRTKSIDSQDKATQRRGQRTWSPRRSNWTTLPALGTQSSRSLSRGRRCILLRLYSSPSSCLVTWTSSGLQGN